MQYVLTERISATDAELKEERSRMSQLVADNEKLLDEVAKLKIAKAACESLSMQQASRLTQLDSDLSYCKVCGTP
jgi:hypothetical protein